MADGSTNQYIHVGEKNGLRLPAYHRLDVSATYKLKIGNTESNIGLSLFNLYGRQNVWYNDFEITDDELYMTEVNMLGFTPNLFFNIKF